MVVMKNNPTSVVHFCGYEEEPSEREYEALKVELDTDPAFGFVGEIGDLLFLPATPDTIDFFRPFVESEEKCVTHTKI